MVRFNLDAIEKRIAKFESRALLLDVPALPIIDVMTWDETERAAYATGTEAERSALETKHVGSLPTHIPGRPTAAVAIVVCEVRGIPDDDDLRDETGPSHWDEKTIERIRAQHAEMLAGIAGHSPIADPRDPNPDGNPTEVIYYKSGYPVTRAEHQTLRDMMKGTGNE